MDPNLLPGNSRDDKPGKPKEVARATVGSVKRRVKPKSPIIGDMSRIASDIGTDILLPAIKTLMSELITNGINMILYGNSNVPRGRSTGYGGRQARSTRYGGFYDEPRRPDRIHARPVTISDKIDQMVYNPRSDAEMVLGGMQDRIREYGVVTMADMYNLAGVSSDYTDSAYGWMSVDSARIVPGQGGYSLELPEPVELER